MPECQAYGCTNRHGAGKSKGKRFFVIPDGKTDPEKRELSQKWLHQIGTGHSVDNFTFHKYKVVCEDHFEEKCFEEDVKAKLMGTKPRKNLKTGSFPTIFVHRRPKEGHGRALRLLKRSAKQEINQLLTAKDQPPSKKLCQPLHCSPKGVSSLFDPPAEVLSPAVTPTTAVTRITQQFIPDALSRVCTSTQTDKTDVTEMGCQAGVPQVKTHHACTVELDHPYSRLSADVSSEGMAPPQEAPPQQETLPPQRSLEQHKSPLKIEKGEDNSDSSEKGSQDDEKRDPYYEPEAELPILSPTDSFATKAVEERKFIVFEANIEQLCYHIQCSQCSSNVTEIEKQVVGSGLLATLKCISGHVVLKWTSQPLDGRMPIGNLLCSAATMFSGLTYQRVAQFMKFLNLQFFSATIFYDLQKMYLIPEINSYWDAHQKAVVDILKGSPIDLIGDGRCDSPGFSAKYCSYSLMDVSSEKVVDMELVQVSETGASQRMEAVGFQRCMDRVLNDYKLNVKRFATDRHTGIRKLMRTKYSSVKHNFDIFHLAKNVKSQLRKAAKKKGNEELEPWIKSITNHLWFCARACNKDQELLVQMWSSVVYHVLGQHEWADDPNLPLFQKCSHDPLTDLQQRKKVWLKAGSSAHEALKKVALAKRLLKDIKFLAEFMHTGALEVFHNVLLKYAPKRLEFGYSPMTARLKLAAIDHNQNVGRAKAVVKKPHKGSSARGEIQYKKVFTKMTKSWVLKARYEAKNYDYVKDLMKGVVDRRRTRTIDPVPAAPAKNIAPTEAPSKEEMLKSHASRF